MHQPWTQTVVTHVDKDVQLDRHVDPCPLTSDTHPKVPPDTLVSRVSDTSLNPFRPLRGKVKGWLSPGQFRSRHYFR